MGDNNKTKVAVADNGVNPRLLSRFFPNVIFNMAEEYISEATKKTGNHGTEVAYVLLNNLSKKFRSKIELINIPLIPNEKELGKQLGSQNVLPPVPDEGKLRLTSHTYLSQKKKLYSEIEQLYSSLKIDIINCSFSEMSLIPSNAYLLTKADFEETIRIRDKYVRQRLKYNDIIVKAAGNYDLSQGDFSTSYSDNIAELIVVGAYYLYNTPGWVGMRSTPGSNVLICSSGLHTTVGQRGEGTISPGTSFGSPFITALVTMMRMTNSSLTVSDIKDLLISNASQVAWDKMASPYPEIFSQLEKPFLKEIKDDIKLIRTRKESNSGQTYNGQKIGFDHEGGFGRIDQGDIQNLIEDAKYYHLVYKPSEPEIVTHEFTIKDFDFSKSHEIKFNAPKTDGVVKEINVRLESDTLTAHDVKTLSLTSPSQTKSYLVTPSTSISFIEKIFNAFQKFNPVEYSLLKYSNIFLDRVYKHSISQEYGSQHFRNEPLQKNNQSWTLNFNTLRKTIGDLKVTFTAHIDKNRRAEDNLHKLSVEQIDPEKGFVIEDNNGGIDTLYYPGSTLNSEINLSPGQTLFFKDQYGMIVGKIADNTHIENVVAGQGNDEINGNDLDNTIFGLGGDDIIRPENGNDVIDGGEGRDTAEFYTHEKGYCLVKNCEEVKFTDLFKQAAKFKGSLLDNGNFQIKTETKTIEFDYKTVETVVIPFKVKNFIYSVAKGEFDPTYVTQKISEYTSGKKNVFDFDAHSTYKLNDKKYKEITSNPENTVTSKYLRSISYSKIINKSQAVETIDISDLQYGESSFYPLWSELKINSEKGSSWHDLEIKFESKNIKNFVGGKGDDIFEDNEKNNIILTQGGDDRIKCTGGVDYIDGGAGYDELTVQALSFFKAQYTAKNIEELRFDVVVGKGEVKLEVTVTENKHTLKYKNSSLSFNPKEVEKLTVSGISDKYHFSPSNGQFDYSVIT